MWGKAEPKNESNNAGAVLMGAAVGAAVTAGAYALSDRKRRKKILNAVSMMADKAKDTVDSVKEKFYSAEEKIKSKLDAEDAVSVVEQ